MTIRLTSWLKPLIASRPWNNRYSQGAAKLAGSVLLAQVIAFIGGLILARYLYPPATQDQMARFLWLINTLTPLCTLRYDIGIVMPKGERGAIKVFQLSFLSSMLTALLAVPAVVLCGIQHYDTWSSLLWVPCTILAQGVTNTFIGWCNRRHFFGMQSTTKVILAACYPLLAAGACLLWGANPANLPAAYSLAAVLGAGVFAIALHRTSTLPTVLWRYRDWRRLWTTAYSYRQLPLLSMPSYTINMASFVVLINALQSFTAGTSASFNLVFQILRVPAVLVGMAVGQVFTAKAATLINQPAALAKLTLATVGGLTALAVPFALTFVFFGPFGFTCIYGPAWREAGEFSQWLAWGAASALIATPLGILPTLLHSNRAQFFLTLVIASARCSVGWMASQGASPRAIIIGSTVVDVAATVVFLLFVFWLLHRQKTSLRPAPLT